MFCLFRAALLSASPAVYWLGMVSKRKGIIWGEVFHLVARSFCALFGKLYSVYLDFERIMAEKMLWVYLPI
jgi:hypothetical protein